MTRFSIPLLLFAIACSILPTSAVQAAVKYSLPQNAPVTVGAADGDEIEISGTYAGAAAAVTVQSGYRGTIVLNGTDIAPSANFPAVRLDPGASPDIVVSGDNRLVGGGTFAGLSVPVGAEVRLRGTGKLVAKGRVGSAAGDVYAKSGGGAGIGGANSAAVGERNAGAIVIEGGTIEATGGSNSVGSSGAGIGGGYAGSGGTVAIAGGVVTAVGGSAAVGAGAGIGGGGGAAGAGASVAITGGIVKAMGGSGAQDIGKGRGALASNSGTTAVTGGSVEVTAADKIDNLTNGAPNADPLLLSVVSGVSGRPRTLAVSADVPYIYSVPFDASGTARIWLPYAISQLPATTLSVALSASGSPASPGNTAVFRVEAVDNDILLDDTLRFLWREKKTGGVWTDLLDDAEHSGAASRDLMLAVPDSILSGGYHGAQYECVVTDKDYTDITGTSDSEALAVRIKLPENPASSGPKEFTVKDGETKELDVGEIWGGSGDYAYRWERSSDGVGGWQAAGGQNAEYVAGPLTPATSPQYFRCAVSESSDVSNAATSCVFKVNGTNSSPSSPAGPEPHRPPATGIVIVPPAGVSFRVGTSFRLEAALSPIGAVGVVIYETSDSTLARVGPDGLVHLLKAGKVSIFAKVSANVWTAYAFSILPAVEVPGEVSSNDLPPPIEPPVDELPSKPDVPSEGPPNDSHSGCAQGLPISFLVLLFFVGRKLLFSHLRHRLPQLRPFLSDFQENPKTTCKYPKQY